MNAEWQKFMVDMNTEFSKATSYHNYNKVCGIKSVPAVIGLKSLVFIEIQIFKSFQVQ